MTAHHQVADLLKQAKLMGDKLIALPWNDLSEVEFDLVFPLGVGLVESIQAAADYLAAQRTAS